MLLNGLKAFLDVLIRKKQLSPTSIYNAELISFCREDLMRIKKDVSLEKAENRALNSIQTGSN